MLVPRRKFKAEKVDLYDPRSIFKNTLVLPYYPSVKKAAQFEYVEFAYKTCRQKTRTQEDLFRSCPTSRNVRFSLVRTALKDETDFSAVRYWVWKVWIKLDSTTRFSLTFDLWDQSSFDPFCHHQWPSSFCIAWSGHVNSLGLDNTHMTGTLVLPCIELLKRMRLQVCTISKSKRTFALLTKLNGPYLQNHRCCHFKDLSLSVSFSTHFVKYFYRTVETRVLYEKTSLNRYWYRAQPRAKI